MRTPKFVIALIVLAALVVCSVIFGLQVLRLVPLVEVENSLTPTPPRCTAMSWW